MSHPDSILQRLRSVVRRCVPPKRNDVDLLTDESFDSDSFHIASRDRNSKTSSQFLSTGFTLIGYTFLLQLGLHLMTFFLNGLAYRRLDTLSLGLVNVRIGLFYTTFMFVSRDAFRRAFLSRGGEIMASPDPFTFSVSDSDSGPTRHSEIDEQRDAFARLIDSAWTIVPVGLIVACLLLIIWLWILPSPGTLATMYSETSVPMSVLQKRYFRCLLVYALSGLFELATEPFWLTCQLSHLVRERIFIEAFANAARAFGIVVAIFTVHPKYAIYSLGIPQILHGTTLFVTYMLFYNYVFRRQYNSTVYQLKGITQFRDLFPRTTNFNFDRRAIRLARDLFAQGLLKQLLTEGERYLISGFHLLSFSDQAVYDLVHNLGSTATRLLFLPMEESCHFVFNQCLNRDLRPNQQDLILLSNVFRMLRTVLRACSLTAWIGLTFAQANSRLLLFIYAGPAMARNSVACGLLRFYAAYVLLLAWNGSTEAFLNAAMSTIEVTKHNERLITFSVIFLGANWVFVPRLGAQGFLVANCINMLCRIYYSCSYIVRFTRAASTPPPGFASDSSTDHPTHGFSLLHLMFPSKPEFLVLFISLVGTLLSETFLCCDSGVLLATCHAMITGVFLLSTLYVMYHQETDSIQVLRNQVLQVKTE